MKKRSAATYSVYVVELSRKVWSDNWKFREANPHYMGALECLYVGMTSLSPRARLDKHKTAARSKKGHKISSWYVEKYGLYLRPSLYQEFNPLSKTAAATMERTLAERLRSQGYAVWWN